MSKSTTAITAMANANTKGTQDAPLSASAHPLESRDSEGDPDMGGARNVAESGLISLLKDLIEAGITIEAVGDELRCTPTAAMTSEIVERLRAKKAQVLAVLRAPDQRLALQWHMALDKLEANGQLPTEMLEGLRRAEVRWEQSPPADEPELDQEDSVLQDEVPRCPRCSTTNFVDTAIHDGRSIRRDCGRCGRTFGFPVWKPHPD